jgi:hypothetical protein
MSVLTRIKNNQIVNSTIIASQKIAAGTITGSLFSSNVTVPGDLLISGNLFVLGTSAYTTIASTNTFVNDPLITLNNGFAGSNTYDEGLVFNRGSLQNRAIIWSEYFQEFRLIGTTEVGTTYGNVVTSSFANLHIGNLIVDYTITHNGNFITTGFINTTGNISAATGLFGAINSTGLINTTGNVSASQVSVATLNATGLINTLGNISASEGSFATISATGLINTLGNISTAQLNAGQINTTGNVLANGAVVNTLTVNGTAGVVTLNATTLTATGNVIGGLAQFAALNATPIGNATPSTGEFTTLIASQYFYANANIATVTQGQGAIVVPNGGISVGGAANIAQTATVLGATQLNSTLGVGGISTFTNTTNATTINNGAVIIQGGASVAKDLYVGGNLYAANIIGITANVITVEDPLVFFKPSYTFPYNYDIGFYSAFTGPGLTTAGNVLQHTAVIRNDSDNTWTFASNLAEPGAGHVVFGADTVYDPIKAGNLTLVNTTAATSTGTGALIVAGGAGIGGTLFVGSTINTAGNVLAAAGVFSGLTVNGNESVTGYLNVAGNVMATVFSGGKLTTTAAGNAADGAGQIFLNGATSNRIDWAAAGTGAPAFTTRSDGTKIVLYPSLSGSVTDYALGVDTATIWTSVPEATSGFNFKWYGATTLVANLSGTGNFTTAGGIVVNSTVPASSSATGALIVKGGAGIAGNLYAGAGIQDTAIGNVTAASGDFTRLAATGTIWANAATDTTSLSTGALIVAGGAAVGKTLWVGEGAVINSTRAAEAFQVYGATGNNGLIYADTAKSAIVFSDTGNTTVQNGVITKFDSDGAIILPVGSSARRPSGAGNVDLIGMIRFNSTISNLEFYDGASWQTAGSTFTVISDRQFSGNVGGGYGNVDGTNTTFTLQANSTTAGTIVSINGVIQFPTLAYSVSGATMTFTEPPAPDDVIDARILTTTSIVTSIASANGYNQFLVDNTSASIYTGTSSSIQRLSVSTDGQINLLTGNEITYDQTAVSVPNTNLTLLDSFSANAYTTAKYIVSMKQNTGNVQAMEALLTQSTVGTTAGTAYVTTYGIVNTGNTMGSLAANVDVSGSWTVKMWLIPNNGTAISNVKVMTTYIV